MKWLNILLRNPLQIAKWLGFNKLTVLHNQWMVKMINTTEDMTLLAHRESFKSTSLSIVIAILMVVKPRMNIILVRKTDKAISETMTQVKKILLSPVMQLITTKIYGFPVEIIKGSLSEITTNLRSDNRGVSQLVALGIGSAITGMHSPLVITDDIVTQEDRYSPAERERTCRVYRELSSNILIRGGRMLNCGTPWHKDDAISLMNNVERYDCCSTGLMSDAEIAKKRKTTEPGEFAANYELRYVASDRVLFRTPPQYMQMSSAEADRLLFDGVGQIDAAYGGEDGNALTIGKRGRDGLIYMFGRLEQGHINNWLDSYTTDARRLRISFLLTERNADKGFLSNEIDEKGVIGRTYHEKMSKYQKIAMYGCKWWDRIRWHPETDKEYIQQVMEFSEHAAHDDAADSMAVVLRYLDDD